MSAHDSPCPCGYPNTYADCCQPYHQQQKSAPTPELLMRARYTAFVMNNLEYLLQTWHPATCPAELDLHDNPQWIKLEVVSAGVQKYPRHNLGKVHFRAICRDNENRLHMLDEHSRFEKVGGRWLYVNGDNTFSKID